MFDSQLLHGSSQPSVTLVPVDPTPLWLPWTSGTHTIHIHTYMQNTHTHEIIKIHSWKVLVCVYMSVCVCLYTRIRTCAYMGVLLYHILLYSLATGYSGLNENNPPRLNS